MKQNAVIRNIEKKWIDNFKKCPLVDKETAIFQSAIAYQLFYGKNDDNYPVNYPDNFIEAYSSMETIDRDSAIDTIITFLNFIGIKLKKVLLIGHLERYPDDFKKLTRKCYYILKSLAHYNDQLNIHNPYFDNSGDLYFLLRIESEESVKGGQLHLFEDIELPELYNRYITLPEGYDNDIDVQNLFSRIENSKESFFITGKAGTGKSTFIHYFTRKTNKKALVVAFTGIAAINIGGQTIHSLFRFPLRPLLPSDEGITIFQRYMEKYLIFEKIDTLIIDEVSMLRADILEGIDYSLRQNGGNKNELFGGKQILFVGDIFQLPPVHDATDEVEGYLFKELFNSPYFFDSLAYKKLNPKYFEFKRVHRQKDDSLFVELLDRVRICQADIETISKLNEKFNPEYSPKPNEFVINLTTTNLIADTENAKKLRELPYTKFAFQATITGEFPTDRYPTNQFLELKKGAQVIFIKNDSGKRWVNGTIAKIDFITEDRIEIRLQNGSTHLLEKVTWENRKYKYNRESHRIVSEVIGTYTQYPVKLAWAITIHKSQGLTFDNVIVDLGSGAFVNGQLYTALSRCRKFDGLVLKRKIRADDVIADKRIINFHETEQLLNSIKFT